MAYEAGRSTAGPSVRFAGAAENGIVVRSFTRPVEAAIALHQVLGGLDVLLEAEGAFVGGVAGDGQEHIDVTVGPGQFPGKLIRLTSDTNAFAFHGGVLWSGVVDL